MNRQQRRAAQRGRSLPTAPAHARVGGGSVPTVPTPAECALDEGRFEDAERRARRLLATTATDTRARAVLARALWRQGRLDEAMLEARRLVRACPEDPAAHEDIGFILYTQDRLPEATTAFERALEIAPDRLRARVGLANCLSALGLLGEALAQHQHAVEVAPGEAAVHSDLALTHFRMGEFEEAAARFRRATALATGAPPLLEWNTSLALLGAGDLTAGWRHYEAGLAAGARVPNRTLDRPRWTGDDLSGRSLLVWGEQGLGDEVRFASCYEEVVRAADHVVIEARPRLVSLFARSFPDATVRAHTVDAEGRETGFDDDMDLHSPAGALPRHLRPTIDAFPRRRGYLVPDPVRRAEFRSRLDALPDGLRVGICWRSAKLDTSRLANYLTLDEWAPALTRPGMTYVNLQYGDVALREDELDRLEDAFGTHVHRWADVDYTNDLEAAAALTSELDVVLGPNSFPVMLAGALGVRTLTVHPPSMWTLGSQGDPWFPATSHFVRAWDEPWAPAVERLADHLDELRDAQ